MASYLHVDSMGILFMFSYLDSLSAYQHWCSYMTRNSPDILPYCPHCGTYKGVGPCKNSKCDKTVLIDLDKNQQHTVDCRICSKEGIISCPQCGGYYCEEHAMGYTENKLISIDQYMGTCVICNQVVCELCWIFDSNGAVNCLRHLQRKDKD